MDRIEIVREYVDGVLSRLPDALDRRYAYLHIYGVAQACSLIAMRRKENVELAVIAGMLHDIYRYTAMEAYEHAHKGAEMARGILKDLGIFQEEEIEVICSAIYYHSSKREKHGSFDEVLKDADVMQHCLYNPLVPAVRNDWVRYEKLKKEFGLK
ncbi:MAG: HD domain-containing protein [Butyricicoccaceae bacterium]